MYELQKTDLLRSSSYINGKWLDSEMQFDVRNPFDDSLAARVSEVSDQEISNCIKAAEKAQIEWSSITARERSRILRRWYDLMILYKEDLAYILTLEQGKPLKEALGEIEYGASFIEWFSEEANRIYGDSIPSHDNNKRIITIKQAIGVVAAITPWNFPNSMITRKAGAALAAGCSIIVKPAKATPLSALALAQLADEAGIPPGVFNVITSSRSSEVGDLLCASQVIRKLSFTGSTSVGKQLIKKSASNVKRLSMELGGNAPFIVFEDADIDKAVEGAIQAKFRNAGQTCVCSNRIFVQASVLKEFNSKLIEAIKKLKVGNGMLKGIEIGPLINSEAVNFVDDLVKDAIENGAKLELGAVAKGNFYSPTVLSNVDPGMRINQEEIFGPVAPIISFDTEAEVVKMANDTPYGLASYFYGSDMSRIWRVAEALEYGMVGINTGLISTTVAPFGGIKESGFGREGSKYGVDEYTVIKYLCFGNIQN